jgi:hypothetical protein
MGEDPQDPRGSPAQARGSAGQLPAVPSLRASAAPGRSRTPARSAPDRPLGVRPSALTSRARARLPAVLGALWSGRRWPLVAAVLSDQGRRRLRARAPRQPRANFPAATLGGGGGGGGGSGPRGGGGGDSRGASVPPTRPGAKPLPLRARPAGPFPRTPAHSPRPRTPAPRVLPRGSSADPSLPMWSSDSNSADPPPQGPSPSGSWPGRWRSPRLLAPRGNASRSVGEGAPGWEL